MNLRQRRRLKEAQQALMSHRYPEPEYPNVEYIEVDKEELKRPVDTPKPRKKTTKKKDK